VKVTKHKLHTHSSNTLLIKYLHADSETEDVRQIKSDKNLKTHLLLVLLHNL
jgi:hypothetical protein